MPLTHSHLKEPFHETLNDLAVPHYCVCHRRQCVHAHGLFQIRDIAKRYRNGYGTVTSRSSSCTCSVQRTGG